ncbi:hypothetical protein [Actinoallomurus sp. NPDC052274]|uniref:hypothetical protein n=1 Tax=Actinoallomurus sp. NPDC052274 TaxID=3155420 RepID=UPI0034212F9C
MQQNRNAPEEITALVELCRQLAAFGLNVGMSDARPAISVRNGVTGRKLWISVDVSRASFVWRRDDHDHHPVDDPVGAADRIAAYLKKRDDRPGRRP